MQLPGTYFGSEPSKQQQSRDNKVAEGHGAQPSQLHWVCVREVGRLHNKRVTVSRDVLMIMAIVASSQCGITTKTLELNYNNISHQKF